MLRLSFLSCRPFLFTYAQIFLTTSVRGSGLSPTTLASAALGWSGFMNAALGLRADFLPVSPAAKTERTLTEDARPSKALSPSGDPLRPPARPPNRGCLSSPLWSGDAQHTEPSPAQQDGRAGGGGRGQPLARLLLRREHQRLASRDEQALCLEQLAGEHRFAGGRRGLAQDEPRAALRQGFGQEDRLPDLERLAAEGQGRGVSAEEGGVEEVAILRDDL